MLRIIEYCRIDVSAPHDKRIVAIEAVTGGLHVVKILSSLTVLSRNPQAGNYVHRCFRCFRHSILSLCKSREVKVEGFPANGPARRTAFTQESEDY